MKRVNKIYNTDRLHQMGITGRGTAVVIFDTGIYKHMDFDNRIIAFKDFINNKIYPYDDNGHGTHIAGIIGGSGKLSKGLYKGIAPECNIVAVKVLDKNGTGDINNVLKAIQWVIANREHYNIKTANISIGANPDKSGEDSELVKAVNRLWDKGITVVVAAGNNGPGSGTVTAPGISRKVITVGACDDNIAVVIDGSRMVNYSGRGPTCNCIKKPDVVAPAGDVVSTKPISRGIVMDVRDGYIKKSGTSMATPIVTGAVTLLLSKYPGISNKEVKMCIKNSSTDLGYMHDKQGWGMLNIWRLLEEGKRFTN